MRLLRRAARINHMHSMGLARGDGKVGVAHTSEKRPVLLFKTVLIFFRTPVLMFPVATPGAFHRHAHVVVQQDR